VKIALVYAALVVAASALFLVFPGIDLWASGLFYRPGAGFFLKDWPLFQALYRAVPLLTWAVALLVLAAFLFRFWRKQPLFGLDGARMGYLVLALALGPGLVVNAVLKDHWGRARPSQVVEFGGEKRFTPAPLPADECARNCSFAGGHAAMGFYLVAFAFLVRDPRRRRVAEIAALAAGVAVGLTRIAQGGHFLSDVVFAGLIVWGISRVLFVLVVERAALNRLPEGLAGIRASPRLSIGLAAGAVLAAIVLSVLFLDRPLAVWARAQSDGVHATFRFITQFGVSTGYLVATSLAFLALRLAARRSAKRATQFIAWSYVPGFVFLAIAASGIVVDILKALVGRARPKLLFADEAVFAFSLFGRQADYWSFPSGHAATIVALATALTYLWPGGLPVYLLAALLVGASRVIITAHYLSDVIAGSFIALLVTVYLKQVFERSGVSLVQAKAGYIEPIERPPWRVRLGLRGKSAGAA
jgi:lipid A 4'-phosphatase